MTKHTFLKGRFEAIPERDISEKTCQKAGYYVTIVPEDYPARAGNMAKWKGQRVEFWNHIVDGKIVGQKVRGPDDENGKKQFAVIGDIKTALFGRRSSPAGGKILVITEGEYDCMSHMECRENWPVVSIPNGTGSARQAIEANLDYIETFEKVILAFDNDAAGKEAQEKVKGLISPGKLHFHALPPNYKDFNEAWMAGDTKAIVGAIFNAEKVKLQGLVEVDDVIDLLDEPVTMGLPWFLPKLTEWTYGRYPGQLIGLGAATGGGKTDFIYEQVLYDVTELGMDVCTILLETPPDQTINDLASKKACKFFEPIVEGEEPSYDPKERRKAAEVFRGKVHMYDSFGQTDWEDVKTFIRQIHHEFGCILFYLDHLTALADTKDEKGSLEQITAEAAGLCQELGIIILYVSHLTTPEGTPHEEGGRVKIRHFKGSRAIGFWSHTMVALERDQQAEDELERRTTTVRMLKIRKRGAGRNNGKTCRVVYQVDTGRLLPAEDHYEENLPEF